MVVLVLDEKTGEFDKSASIDNYLRFFSTIPPVECVIISVAILIFSFNMFA